MLAGIVKHVTFVCVAKDSFFKAPALEFKKDTFE